MSAVLTQTIEQKKATNCTYVGLFLTALSTLMFEILLTRIFSVTMWYHFAFMAISVAMFGMSVGAIAVYLKPKHFTYENAPVHLALYTLLFALSVLLSFSLHLYVPFIIPGKLAETALNVVVTYIVIAVPFIFSGISVCLALTRFPRNVASLYSSDLIGASLGCLLLVPLLSLVDGPTAVLVTAATGALAALCFACGTESRQLRIGSAVSLAVLLVLITVNIALSATHRQPIRLQWVHGSRESTPLHEKWNCFSRIRIAGDPAELHRPMAWGLSDAWPADRKVSELNLTIDAGADTVLTAFRGDFKEVEHLKYDLTNLAHYLRPDSRVLVLGVGGGRDVLSALAFKQRHVDGVEINDNILEAVTSKFADYTGHLEKIPQVSLINDEARSFVARSGNLYDIIQISLVDTSAATAAGAYVLTEHSLYTEEAWRTFLQKLTDRGVLTVSRWYFPNRPAEVYRLMTLASSALHDVGVKDVKDHIMVMAAFQRGNGGRASHGIGTILVSKTPFTKEDVAVAEKFAAEKQFKMVYSPQTSSDETFNKLVSSSEAAGFVKNYELNIAAPTDDCPYFFHMLRFKDMFNVGLWEQGVMSANATAIGVLGCLLITVVFLTSLCTLVPLWLTADKTVLKGSSPFLLYFAAIGFAFMFIEISQMQRLIVFLGHPVYGLSVVLFTLLLASGTGSIFSVRLADLTPKRIFAALLVLLVIFGFATTPMTSAFASASTPVRIIISAALLFPIGFFMGMAFPLGMTVAVRKAERLAPWLWGINGATSVCASVIAVVLAMSLGIAATFWFGVSTYAIAFAAYMMMSRQSSPDPALDLDRS